MFINCRRPVILVITSDHMKRSRLYKVLAAVILLCGLAAAATFLGSFRFNPDRSSDASFIARAQQKSASGIKVNASALGTRESQQHFGENLAKYDIQPLWLSIEVILLGASAVRHTLPCCTSTIGSPNEVG